MTSLHFNFPHSFADWVYAIYHNLATPLTGHFAVIGIVLLLLAIMGGAKSKSYSVIFVRFFAIIFGVLFIGASNFGLPIVPSNAVLQQLPSTQFFYVLRLGFYSIGDSPALMFVSQKGSACSLNSGAGDGASQVASGDSKCWLGQFGSKIGFTTFGASPLQTDVVNTIAVQAALNVGHTLGKPLVCDANGILPLDNVTTYSSDIWEWNSGCVIKKNSNTGALITVVDAIGNTYAQNLTFNNLFKDPKIDMNCKTGVAFLLESSLGGGVSNPAIKNVGSGMWTHNDGFAPTGSYPSAGVMIKGNTNVGGAYYNTVSDGHIWPCADKQANSYGVWIGSSVGATGQYGNFNTVRGTLFQQPTGPDGVGPPIGFAASVKVSAGGDTLVDHVNGSSAIDSINLGGDGYPVNRTVIRQLYAEADSNCAVNDNTPSGTPGNQSTSGTSILGWASTAGTPHRYCKGTGSTSPIVWSLGQSLQFDFYSDSLGGLPPPMIANLNRIGLTPPVGTLGEFEADGINLRGEFTTYRHDWVSGSLFSVANGEEVGRYSLRGYDGGRDYEGAYLSGVPVQTFHTQVASATVYQFATPGSIGGDGGSPTNAVCPTLTVQGGTYTTQTVLSGFINSAGHLDDSGSPLTVVTPGDYTSSPGSSGVFVSGCGLTNARVNLTYQTIEGGMDWWLSATAMGDNIPHIRIKSNWDGSISSCTRSGACTGFNGDGGFGIPGQFSSASIIVNGHIVYDTDGHWVANGGVPTITAGTCGTTPGSVTGRDTIFHFTAGTGTVTTCDFLFGTPFQVTAPDCSASFNADNYAWFTNKTVNGARLNFHNNAAGQIVTVMCGRPG